MVQIPNQIPMSQILKKTGYSCLCRKVLGYGRQALFDCAARPVKNSRYLSKAIIYSNLFIRGSFRLSSPACPEPVEGAALSLNRFTNTDNRCMVKCRAGSSRLRRDHYVGHDARPTIRNQRTQPISRQAL